MLNSMVESNKLRRTMAVAATSGSKNRGRIARLVALGTAGLVLTSASAPASASPLAVGCQTLTEAQTPALGSCITGDAGYSYRTADGEQFWFFGDDPNLAKSTVHSTITRNGVFIGGLRKQDSLNKNSLNLTDSVLWPGTPFLLRPKSQTQPEVIGMMADEVTCPAPCKKLGPPVGQRLLSINPSALSGTTITTSASSSSSSSTTLQVQSGAGISNGMFALGTGIPNGTTVSSGGGTTTLVLSNRATVPSAANLSFVTAPFITDLTGAIPTKNADGTTSPRWGGGAVTSDNGAFIYLYGSKGKSASPKQGEVGNVVIGSVNPSPGDPPVNPVTTVTKMDLPVDVYFSVVKTETYGWLLVGRPGPLSSRLAAWPLAGPNQGFRDCRSLDASGNTTPMSDGKPADSTGLGIKIASLDAISVPTDGGQVKSLAPVKPATSRLVHHAMIHMELGGLLTVALDSSKDFPYGTYQLRGFLSPAMKHATDEAKLLAGQPTTTDSPTLGSLTSTQSNDLRKKYAGMYQCLTDPNRFAKRPPSASAQDDSSFQQSSEAILIWPDNELYTTVTTTKTTSGKPSTTTNKATATQIPLLNTAVLKADCTDQTLTFLKSPLRLSFPYVTDRNGTSLDGAGTLSSTGVCTYKYVTPEATGTAPSLSRARSRTRYLDSNPDGTADSPVQAEEGTSLDNFDLFVVPLSPDAFKRQQKSMKAAIAAKIASDQAADVKVTFAAKAKQIQSALGSTIPGLTDVTCLNGAPVGKVTTPSPATAKTDKLVAQLNKTRILYCSALLNSDVADAYFQTQLARAHGAGRSHW